MERAIRAARSGHAQPLPRAIWTIAQDAWCLACQQTSASMTYGTTSLLPLIASGGDVKVVQARLRHASAKTSLDSYGHRWPDSDDSTRAAISDVIAARVKTDSANPADSLRTDGHA